MGSYVRQRSGLCSASPWVLNSSKDVSDDGGYWAKMQVKMGFSRLKTKITVLPSLFHSLWNFPHQPFFSAHSSFGRHGTCALDLPDSQLASRRSDYSGVSERLQSGLQLHHWPYSPSFLPSFQQQAVVHNKWAQICVYIELVFNSGSGILGKVTLFLWASVSMSEKWG